jgi:hypothetical protein
MSVDASDDIILSVMGIARRTWIGGERVTRRTYLPDIIGLKLELLLGRSNTKEIIVVVQSRS